MAGGFVGKTVDLVLNCQLPAMFSPCGGPEGAPEDGAEGELECPAPGAPHPETRIRAASSPEMLAMYLMELSPNEGRIE